MHEANYGYLLQREKLAETGVVFEGHHGAGSAYGECVFACYDGEHVEINATEGSPVALVNRNGEVDETSLKNAREYYATLDLVEKYFKGNGIINAES